MNKIKMDWSYRAIRSFTRAELIPIYANLILSNPSDELVKTINNAILSKFKPSGLLYIKDGEWKIINAMRK